MDKILSKLKTEPLERISFVHGEEIVFRDQILEILEKRALQSDFAEWNLAVYVGSRDFSLEQLFNDLQTLPWGSDQKIIIIKDGELIPSEYISELLNFLETKEQTNPLVIFFNRVDNRLKHFRALKKVAFEIECTPLAGERLVRYVQDLVQLEGKKMQRRTVEVFLARVGTNLLMVENELAKLLSFCQGETEISLEAVSEITSLGNLEVANDTIFKLVDLIAQKKRQEALLTLEQLFRAGEVPFRILPLIERQLRLLLAAKTTNVSLDQTAKAMGENSSFSLKKIQPFAKNFSKEELIKGFSLIVEADQAMKLGGDGETILQDLIIQLTR